MPSHEALPNDPLILATTEIAEQELDALRDLRARKS
jgi:hypothetical protein